MGERDAIQSLPLPPTPPLNESVSRETRYSHNTRADGNSMVGFQLNDNASGVVEGNRNIVDQTENNIHI